MKIIGYHEILSRLIAEKSRIIISIAAWDFHFDWQPDVFDGLGLCLVYEVIVKKDEVIDEDTRLGFFEVKNIDRLAALENIAHNLAIRLYVCNPDECFLHELSMSVFRELTARNELSESLITFFSTSKNYSWLALRDGDEGDAFYYFYD